MPETPLAADALSHVRGPEFPELIRDEVLADIFEATARRVPGQIALVCGTRELTYGELDALADRVAARLIEAGVCPGQILGLWLPRGSDLLVMQLGIAKAGAAWLPFDAETPVDRILVCLADAGAAGLLGCAANTHLLAELACPVWTAATGSSTTSPPRRPSSSSSPATTARRRSTTSSA